MSKRFTAASEGTNQVELTAPFFLRRPAVLSQKAPAYSADPNRPVTRAAARDVPGMPPMASFVTSRYRRLPPGCARRCQSSQSATASRTFEDMR